MHIEKEKEFKDLIQNKNLNQALNLLMVLKNGEYIMHDNKIVLFCTGKDIPDVISRERYHVVLNEKYRDLEGCEFFLRLTATEQCHYHFKSDETCKIIIKKIVEHYKSKTTQLRESIFIFDSYRKKKYSNISEILKDLNGIKESNPQKEVKRIETNNDWAIGLFSFNLDVLENNIKGLKELKDKYHFNLFDEADIYLEKLPTINTFELLMNNMPNPVGKHRKSQYSRELLYYAMRPCLCIYLHKLVEFISLRWSRRWTKQIAGIDFQKPGNNS